MTSYKPPKYVASIPATKDDLSEPSKKTALNRIFSDHRMSRNEMKLQQRAYMVALRDLVDTGRYDTRYIQSFHKNTQSVQGKEEG